jgi:hypothetical protein
MTQRALQGRKGEEVYKIYSILTAEILSCFVLVVIYLYTTVHSLQHKVVVLLKETSRELLRQGMAFYQTPAKNTLCGM